MGLEHPLTMPAKPLKTAAAPGHVPQAARDSRIVVDFWVRGFLCQGSRAVRAAIA